MTNPFAYTLGIHDLSTTRVDPGASYIHKIITSAIKDFFTFCVSRGRLKMYFGHARLCVRVVVCVSVRGRTPTLLHGPGCNLAAW